MSGEDTLIPRFLGLIRIKTRMGRNIRLVVMNNLMPRAHKIHKIYDIKGSTLGRWATEEEKRRPHVTLKDLDLKHELALPPWMLEKFQKQVDDDCGWLRMLGIMDYSLLMLVRAVPMRRAHVPCTCRARAVRTPCAHRAHAVRTHSSRPSSDPRRTPEALRGPHCSHGHTPALAAHPPWPPRSPRPGRTRSPGRTSAPAAPQMHFKRGLQSERETDAEYEDSDSGREHGGGPRAASATELGSRSSTVRGMSMSSVSVSVDELSSYSYESPSSPRTMGAASSCSVPAMLEAAAAGAASVATSTSAAPSDDTPRPSRSRRFRLPGKAAARRSRSEDGDSDSDDEASVIIGGGSSASNLPRLNDADLAQARMHACMHVCTRPRPRPCLRPRTSHTSVSRMQIRSRMQL